MIIFQSTGKPIFPYREMAKFIYGKNTCAYDKYTNIRKLTKRYNIHYTFILQGVFFSSHE